MDLARRLRTEHYYCFRTGFILALQVVSLYNRRVTWCVTTIHLPSVKCKNAAVRAQTNDSLWCVRYLDQEGNGSDGGTSKDEDKLQT